MAIHLTISLRNVRSGYAPGSKRRAKFTRKVLQICCLRQRLVTLGKNHITEIRN